MEETAPIQFMISFAVACGQRSEIIRRGRIFAMTCQKITGSSALFVGHTISIRRQVGRVGVGRHLVARANQRSAAGEKPMVEPSLGGQASCDRFWRPKTTQSFGTDMGAAYGKSTEKRVRICGWSADLTPLGSLHHLRLLWRKDLRCRRCLRLKLARETKAASASASIARLAGAA